MPADLERHEQEMKQTIHGFLAEEHSGIESVIEHLEANHGDTLHFIATQRVEDVTDRDGTAAVTELDPSGVTFQIGELGEPELRRFDFAGTVSSTAELQGELMALLGSARQGRPGHPKTSIENERDRTSELRTWVGEVVRIEPVTKNLVEVTLSGLDDMPQMGGDEFFYVMVPNPASPDALGANMAMSEVQALAADEQPIAAAYYTTRRRRGVAGEVDIWILDHGHDDGVAGLVLRANIGQPVVLWGPRRGYEPPADTDAYLLVCDETGLPACCAIIESLGTGDRVDLVVEVVDADHHPAIPAHDALTIHWSYRGATPAGTAGGLLELVQALDSPSDHTYAFGAGESREITAVRRHLRNEVGLAAPRVHMTGYWRRP